jgi:hypothetical protein
VPVPAFDCKVLSTIDNNGALQPRAGLQDNGRSDGPFGHCQGSALCGQVDSGKPLVNAWGQAGLIYDRSDLMPENLGDARIENTDHVFPNGAGVPLLCVTAYLVKPYRAIDATGSTGAGGSDQSDVAFHRPDHRVHLPFQYLFGEAECETFGNMERNMRGQ